MTEITALVENYWICREQDRELYNKVKRDIPKFQKFVREQLGWKLLNHEQFLKPKTMEKCLEQGVSGDGRGQAGSNHKTVYKGLDDDRGDPGRDRDLSGSRKADGILSGRLYGK